MIRRGSVRSGRPVGLGKIAIRCYPRPVGIEFRELAGGKGWRVDDVTCNSGPHDRPYEEQHSSLCIALVTSGTFQYRTAQGSSVMAPGCLMLGNLGSSFSCGHEHSIGDRCLSFSFSPAFFEPILARVPGARRMGFELSRLPPVAPLLPLIAAVQAVRDGPDPVRAEELAMRLVGDVCAVLAGEVDGCPRPSHRDERRVTAALRRMEAAVFDRLSLEELAREVAMSPYHFLRVFERVVGVTPGQYMLRARLRGAAVLLRRSTQAVAAVAAESGFADLSTFNRQFRRIMGASPTEYRARGGANRVNSSGCVASQLATR